MNEKNIKLKIKLWSDNLKSNKISYFIKTIIFIIPYIIIKTSLAELLTNNIYSFVIFILIMLILFIINEYLKAEKLEISTKEHKEHNVLIEHYQNINDILEQIPHDFIRALSKSLDLKNSDRISLYVLNEDKFKIIARYSENPQYNAPHRQEYNINKGYISKCLSNNNGKPYFYKQDLPKYDTQKYKKEMLDTGMTEEEIVNLTMKSRCYFNRLVKDEEYNNVGVLVIESINCKLEYEPEELNNKLEEISVGYMIKLLRTSNILKKSEGF